KSQTGHDRSSDNQRTTVEGNSLGGFGTFENGAIIVREGRILIGVVAEKDERSVRQELRAAGCVHIDAVVLAAGNIEAGTVRGPRQPAVGAGDVDLLLLGEGAIGVDRVDKDPFGMRCSPHLSSRDWIEGRK